MTNWVIPKKLSIEDVWHIPKTALAIMAETSNDMVVYYVNNFIRANLNSQDIITKKVAEKLKESYEEVNNLKDFLSSNEALEIAQELNTLSVADIRATDSPEHLKRLRAIVNMLFQETNFMVGETKALTTDYLETQLQRLVGLTFSYSDSPESSESISRLHIFMDNNRQLFKNAPFRRKNPTVLKYAVNNKDKYELILYGLDFVIEKKERNADARSWRLL